MEWSEKCVRDYTAILKNTETSVEFSLTFYLVQKFLEAGVTVLAACSERVVREEMKDGVYVKNAEFRFVRFRKYI